MTNFDNVWRNLRKYSRGVFKLPPPYRQVMPTPKIDSSEITLPSRHTVEALIANYYSYWHRQAPIVHWPTFTQQVDNVLAAGTFVGIAQIWAGLFFSVLACGTLLPSEHANLGLDSMKGMEYIIISARLLNTWTDNQLADHARTALLISTFMYELNIRSAGWVWLGTAVRMSQDVGLHLENGPWQPHEAAARKRLLWAIIAWDR